MKSLAPVLACCLLVACGANDPTGSSSKGAEEAMPVDGKLDSFASPTDHGELSFGYGQQASITEAEKFHSWTFALSGDADVDLSTSLDAMNPNLDTVLYLYRRDAESGSWGSYIYKNDDDHGKVTSRIAKKLGSGEYRVLVKAFKSSMRGTLSVNGTCEGGGCPGGSTPVCEEDPTLPSSTDYGPACAQSMRNVLVAPTTGSQYFNVYPADKCQTGALGARAIAHYIEYMSDYYDFDMDTDLNVEVTKHGDAGTVVSVDQGGDEDTLEFVFDAQNELVMYYHHEQSPTAVWYCGGGASNVEEPSLDCVSHALGYLPHGKEQAKSNSGTEPFSNLGGVLPAFASKAIESYGSLTSAASNTPVSFDLSQWDDTYATGASLTLDGARPVTFDLYASSSEQEIVFVTDGDSVRFACE